MIELSMHQLQIKEGDTTIGTPKAAERRGKEDEEQADKVDESKLQIFKKIMSSQIDDYNEYLAGPDTGFD